MPPRENRLNPRDWGYDLVPFGLFEIDFRMESSVLIDRYQRGLGVWSELLATRFWQLSKRKILQNQLRNLRGEYRDLLQTLVDAHQRVRAKPEPIARLARDPKTGVFKESRRRPDSWAERQRKAVESDGWTPSPGALFPADDRGASTPYSAPEPSHSSYSGHGGHFGGAGASGNWDSGSSSSYDSGSSSCDSSSSYDSGSSSDGGGSCGGSD